MTTSEKVQTTASDAHSRELVREEELPVSAPAVDIRETRDGYVLTAAMPGVDDTAAEVTIEDSVLTIEGKTVNEAPAGHDLVSQEFEATRYRRSFDVSEQVDVGKAKAKATLKKGVLTIALPKLEEEKSRRENIVVTSE